ncbi:hypothetical protein D3C78_1579020 [compost metagenome]
MTTSINSRKASAKLSSPRWVAFLFIVVRPSARRYNRPPLSFLFDQLKWGGGGLLVRFAVASCHHCLSKWLGSLDNSFEGIAVRQIAPELRSPRLPRDVPLFFQRGDGALNCPRLHANLCRKRLLGRVRVVTCMPPVTGQVQDDYDVEVLQLELL